MHADPDPILMALCHRWRPRLPANNYITMMAYDYLRIFGPHAVATASVTSYADYLILCTYNGCGLGVRLTSELADPDCITVLETPLVAQRILRATDDTQ